jgi:hypothetical protein
MSSGRSSEQFSEHNRGHCEQERRLGSARMLGRSPARMRCMIVFDDEDLVSYSLQPDATLRFTASFPT